MTAKEGLLKAAGIVAVLSVISKFLGFAREASLAAVFGATYATDAYLMGQTVPVVIFSAVSAALGSTFIPVFSQVRQVHGRDAAHKMVSSVINATFLLAVAFIAIGEFFAGPLTRLVAPGFKGEVYALTVSMTRIMFPMVLFQALSGLLTGMLQADDNFAVPAVASLAYNITIIGSILLLGPKFGIPAVGAGTVVAIAAQVVFKLPAIARTGYRWSPILNLNDPGLRRMGALIGPVLLATFAGQASTLVNRILVSGLAEGSLAALNYATRLMGLVPGVVGTSIITVMYPTLSRLSAADDWQRYSKAFSESIKMISFILVPAAVGMAVLRVPIVRIVFERGAFDSEATQATAWALLFLSPAVALFTLRDMTNRAFYALQDTTSPMVVSIFSAGINIVLNIVLVGPLAQGGLALANTLSGAFGAGVLLWILKNKLRKTGSSSVSLGGKAILDSLWRVMLASGIMGVVVWFTYGAVQVCIPGSAVLVQLVRLLIPVLVGVISYVALVFILRVPEARVVATTARNALHRVLLKTRAYSDLRKQA
ncbi:MAG TPA: murein biosynthesis integral membrane protein MurJ [Bacillota bacterium]|nr:murein biosynthesis integral membrane protein MurJ [Bacillota bacterium]